MGVACIIIGALAAADVVLILASCKVAGMSERQNKDKKKDDINEVR